MYESLIDLAIVFLFSSGEKLRVKEAYMAIVLKGSITTITEVRARMAKPVVAKFLPD